MKLEEFNKRKFIVDVKYGSNIFIDKKFILSDKFDDHTKISIYKNFNYLNNIIKNLPYKTLSTNHIENMLILNKVRPDIKIPVDLFTTAIVISMYTNYSSLIVNIDNIFERNCLYYIIIESIMDFAKKLNKWINEGYVLNYE